MKRYLRFLKRRFLWAVAGMIMFLSYTWWWGEGFVRTMLAVTGLSSAEFGSGVLTAGQWLGLVAGSLVVMSPVIAGFLVYVVAWIGWPGRPRPRNPRRLAIISMGLGIAVTAFLVVGLVGNSWPVSSWRYGTRQFAHMPNSELPNASWVGDMFFGLLLSLIGLYVGILLCAAFLPPELDPSQAGRSPVQGGRSSTRLAQSAGIGRSTPAAESADAAPLDGGDLPVTGIWWPFAMGAAVIVLSLLAAVWPHLS